jgi:hypothetical protein
MSNIDYIAVQLAETEEELKEAHKQLEETETEES